MNVTEPIRRIARLNPSATAIIRADGSSISYGVLDHAIDRMAGYAARLGLEPGDVAGLSIAGPDESLGLTLMLALARIGVASAEPNAPAEGLRLRFQAGAATAPGNVGFDACWMSSEPAPADHVPAPIRNDPAALFRIFSSSGTTGRPKHIAVTQAVQLRRVFAFGLADGLGPAVRVIGINLGCSWGCATALRTLWAGGTIVLSNPAHAPDTIPRHGVTSIVTSPVSLRMILDALPPGTGPFPRLEQIEVGGSVVPETLWRMAAERLCRRIVSIVGSGEAGLTASAPIDALIARRGAGGLIVPGVEIEAMDEANHTLPPGHEGVLRIRSDRLASGYLQDPESSTERFRDGWFYSNDIGTVWPDGLLTISGRTSDVINAGGVKVHPQVIESALLKLPLVVDAAAFGVPDATGVTRIWAAIVARSRIDDAVLNAFCRHALPGISPQTILQMKALPRNENGKVRREQLVDIGLHANRRPAEAMAAHV
nr:class I adenylate-forming enzyme family protein [uncultured Rhodopila sp.]